MNWNPLTWFTLKQWLWIGALVSLVGVHYWDVHRQVSDATTQIKKDYEIEKSKAVIAAHEMWANRQGQLDLWSSFTLRNYEDTLKLIESTLAKNRSVYREIVVRDPLPPGCFASPERVQSTNKALTQ